MGSESERWEERVVVNENERREEKVVVNERKRRGRVWEEKGENAMKDESRYLMAIGGKSDESSVGKYRKTLWKWRKRERKSGGDK